MQENIVLHKGVKYDSSYMYFFWCSDVHHNWCIFCQTYEPPHDKINKMSVRQAKTQINLGIGPVWPGSSLYGQWVVKDPSFLHADREDSDQTWRMVAKDPMLLHAGQWRLWSDWADAQADLSSLGAQPFCWFCHVVAQMLSYVKG